MSKGNTLRNEWLKLYFTGTPIPGLADNAAVSPCTQHTLALHTSDPGAGGSQSTYETAYAGYLRKIIQRNTAGWTVSGNSVSPSIEIEFDLCSTDPGPPITHWSVSRGSGLIDYSGPLVTPLVMVAGVSPRLTTLSTIQEL